MVLGNNTIGSGKKRGRPSSKFVDDDEYVTKKVVTVTRGGTPTNVDLIKHLTPTAKNATEQVKNIVYYLTTYSNETGNNQKNVIENGLDKYINDMDDPSVVTELKNYYETSYGDITSHEKSERDDIKNIINDADLKPEDKVQVNKLRSVSDVDALKSAQLFHQTSLSVIDKLIKLKEMKTPHHEVIKDRFAYHQKLNFEDLTKNVRADMSGCSQDYEESEDDN